MTYFANFNHKVAILGIVLNVEVCADEDQIKSLTLFHPNGYIIKESELPRHEIRSIYDAANHELYMQVKAEAERTSKAFSDRLWEASSSMNRELVDWYNSPEWKK